MGGRPTWTPRSGVARGRIAPRFDGVLVNNGNDWIKEEIEPAAAALQCCFSAADRASNTTP
jgi:hypothetical protein